jgi:hypothetical protein
MTQAGEIAEEVFEVLRTAVTIAKERQIANVESLRFHLGQIYPSRSSDIDSALHFWGNYISSKSSFR